MMTEEGEENKGTGQREMEEEEQIDKGGVD